MPRPLVTSDGIFARELSRKHFTDRMNQSEASRHQPAGEPLSLQADAAGDMRGRQYALYKQAGVRPTPQNKKTEINLTVDPLGLGSRCLQPPPTVSFQCFLGVWLLV